MAENVMVKTLGGQKKVVENCETVADVRAAQAISKDYTAYVNGDAVHDDYELEEGDFVTFSQNLKGGQ